MEPVRYLRNSESETWRDCKLKWYLTYYLGWIGESVNPNFWLGTFVHFCLSEWYLGRSTNPAHLFFMITEQWFEDNRSLAVTIDGEDLDFNEYSQLEDYQKLGIEMLEGYVEWALANDDFAVIDSELAYYIPMTDKEGREFTFVARLDLLGENSEGIRVHDFKTASDFRDQGKAGTYMQFRRYAWVVVSAHPEWKDEVAGSAWVGLRKMSPATNPRSKPPYFDRDPIDLTPEEIQGVENELLAEVSDILSTEEFLKDGIEPRDVIYPSPRFDCSWKCEFFTNGMCAAWRAGVDVTEIGKIHGSWTNDPYAEYKEDDIALIEIGRRES